MHIGSSCITGESLCCIPTIFDMHEHNSQRRISVGLSSNLDHMDTDMARGLVESGLSQLVVSIDGATQETYAAYRHQGDLSKVLKNLELLLELKRSLNSSSPFIIWRMLVGRHNEHEVDILRQMAYSRGVDSFSARALFVNTNDPEQVEQWVPANAAYSAYTQSSGKLENTWSCHDLWESMVMNWDGGTAPCCWLHDPQYDFANVSGQSVRETWNNPGYVSAHRVIRRRKDRSHDVPTICRQCLGHPSYLET
jgi:MoaA/NifB/PqqE/SkfB family radical SAM enzyme